MRTKKAPILTTLAVSLIFASGIFSISGAVPLQSKDKKEQRKQERGIRIPNVKELPAKAKRFALVIGIDQYKDTQINRLDGAANDAKAITEALVEYSGFPQDQVVLLTSSQPQNLQPTKNNILRKLSNLTDGGVPKDGLLLLFFAGHGIEKKEQAFLLPADAEVSSDVKLLGETAINVKTIYEWIQDSKIQQVILILDACRNSPEMGRGDADQKLSKVYTKNFDFDAKNSEITAFATLYASELGQTAYEYKEKKHGYFTWALIEGLKGEAANEKGEITLSGLVKYIQENVPKRISIDLGAGKRQRPFAEIKGYKADELVLASVKAAENNLLSNTITVDPVARGFLFFKKIENSNDPELFQEYLDKFPDGDYVSIAKKKLTELKQQQQPSPARTIDQIPQSKEGIEKKPKESLETKINPNLPAGAPAIPRDLSDKRPSHKPSAPEIKKPKETPQPIAKQPEAQKPKETAVKNLPKNPATANSDVAKDISTKNPNPTQALSDGHQPKEVIEKSVPPNPATPPVAKPKDSSSKEEKIYWNSIDDSNNPEEFKTFLDLFPNGKYAAKAKAKFESLTLLADWNAIQDSQKIGDFKAFLSKYPASPYTKQANTRINEIQETAEWNSIKSSRDPNIFKYYIIVYPKGLFVEDAKARLTELLALNQPKTEPTNALNTKPGNAATTKPPVLRSAAEESLPPTSPITNPESRVLIDKSEKLIRQKKWAEAIEVVKRALKLEPDKAEWHNRLGSLLSERNRWEEAEVEFRKATELEASNALWHNALGTFLSSRGRHGEALEACRKASELSPNQAKFHTDYSQALLNQYGIEQDELYTLWNNPGLRNRLKRIDESGIVQAETEARKAIALEPQNPYWLIHFSKVLIWLDRAAEAEREVRQAIQLSPPNPDWQNQLGLTLLAQEKFPEAEAAFREALRFEPSNTQYKANLKKALQK